MKRLFPVFMAVGMAMSSCGGTECITCTGESATFNTCSDNTQFADDEAWDAYVTSSTTEAALVYECIDCQGVPSYVNICSNDSTVGSPAEWDAYVQALQSLYNCNVTNHGGNTCTVE